MNIAECMVVEDFDLTELVKEESRRLDLSGRARKAQIVQGHIDYQSLLLPATKEQGQEWECLPSSGSPSPPGSPCFLSILYV